MKYTVMVMGLVLIICLACAQQPRAQSTAAAQSSSPAIASLDAGMVHRISVEVRSRYSVPPEIAISVSAPSQSDVPGYDRLTVTFTGGTHTSSHEFLISKDHKTLAHLEKMDISADLMSQIDVKGRPMRGESSAPVTIVNFDDFECPYCSRMHTTLFPTVFKSYGDRLKVIYKDYPLVEIHPWAMHAAVDANCLADQSNEAYWDFADYVHSNQKLIGGSGLAEAYKNLDKATDVQGQKHKLDNARLQACVSKQDDTDIKASMVEGDKLGVDSTPTLFINGERVSGAVPEDQLRMIIDRALADAAPGSSSASPAAAAKK